MNNITLVESGKGRFEIHFDSYNDMKTFYPNTGTNTIMIPKQIRILAKIMLISKTI